MKKMIFVLMFALTTPAFAVDITDLAGGGALIGTWYAEIEKGENKGNRVIVEIEKSLLYGSTIKVTLVDKSGAARELVDINAISFSTHYVGDSFPNEQFVACKRTFSKTKTVYHFTPGAEDRAMWFSVLKSVSCDEELLSYHNLNYGRDLVKDKIVQRFGVKLNKIR